MGRERIGGFLCRDEHERRWMLEMHERLLPVTRIGGVLAVAMAVAIVPWTNPLALLPVLVASLGMAAAIAGIARTGDVRLIFPAVLGLQVGVAIAILVNHRAGVGDLFLLVTAIVPASGGFPGRVVTAVAVVSAVLMTALALVTGVALASPPTLILPLFTLASVTLLSTAIRRASIDHRRAAIVDGLTGTLNRVSLDGRAAELQAQTRASGDPVAVVVVDIDDFKLVNDLYGHRAGDRVLVALAELLRGHGEAFRLGGDEFVVLLHGVAVREACTIAEAIVAGVRAAPLGDVPVTVSVGVAGSPRGTRFDFADVFEGADTALYAAKRDGRDAVRTSAAHLAAA